MTSCVTCKHFTGRLGPQGICTVWQKVMTSAQAAVHVCSL
jgi:hypothetical protein